MDNLNQKTDASFGDLFEKDGIIQPINKDEALWDKLIQQIIDGNVIPIIGTDLLTDNKDNPHKMIVDFLAKGFHAESNPTNFPELICDINYKRHYKSDDIYYIVNTILEHSEFVPSLRLQKLLSIRQFPFVITTSFTPIVEQAMREVWKDELKIMQFNNTPFGNDDIKDSADLRKPTVYYMFGKVGKGAHKYALTDIDMLDYVISWCSDNGRCRPRNLCRELKEKYLLMIGNNYSDWLFRFIWYSMRNFNLGHGMYVYDTADKSLLGFMEHFEVFTKHNTSYVIDQMLLRINTKLEENEYAKFNRPEENVDVYISYSRNDGEIAERLYNALTAHGKRVWYDKNNIMDGGNYRDDIRRAIRTAKYFIPILSENVTKEINLLSVYRFEWDTAIEVASSMGRKFIIPLAELGFDFYNSAIPERIQSHNALSFSGVDDIEIVVEKIIHTINND